VYHAFPPLVPDNPKILILGTFPSPLSREKGEYYGNPQNKFWKIIFDVFGAARLRGKTGGVGKGAYKARQITSSMS
jgi:hypoxanthine-DNA glycosylase